MEIEYIYDGNGQKRAVIIPIELWEKMHSAKKKGLDPNKYKGIYRSLSVDWEKEIENLRNEWVRQ